MSLSSPWQLSKVMTLISSFFIVWYLDDFSSSLNINFCWSRIGVITPTLGGFSNSHNFSISETIKSVKSQSYLNWECIIIDDNSNDNSLNIIKNEIKYNDLHNWIISIVLLLNCLIFKNFSMHNICILINQIWTSFTSHICILVISVISISE